MSLRSPHYSPTSFKLCNAADADLYYSNQTNSNWSFTAVPASQQLRWDSWARLTEPLLATVPAVLVGGNHEAELQPDVPGHPTFTAFNARYPQPQVRRELCMVEHWRASAAGWVHCATAVPASNELYCGALRCLQNRDSIETAPNLSDFYLNASNSKQFVNTSDCACLVAALLRSAVLRPAVMTCLYCHPCPAASCASQGRPAVEGSDECRQLSVLHHLAAPCTCRPASQCLLLTPAPLAQCHRTEQLCEARCSCCCRQGLLVSAFAIGSSGPSRPLGGSSSVRGT